MKKLFLSLFLSIIILNCEAQSFHTAQQIQEKLKIQQIYNPKDFYLGIETGMNSYTGILGISAFLRANKTLFIKAGLGEGTWGYKASIGLKLDYDSIGKWSYGIGYSICSGANNVKAKVPVLSGQTKEVTINYLKASSINFTVTRNWKIGKKKKDNLNLDFGYAFALEKQPWKVTDGSILASTSETALKIMQPGGAILGIGFTFGL